MAQQTIGIGTNPNDGTGDNLRVAFDKINDNFDELYAKGAAGSDLELTANKISSVDTNGNIELDPNGTGKVVIFGTEIVINTSKTVSTAIGSSGDTQGDFAWDSSYLYICTADYDGSTSIWRRVSVASW